MNLRYLLVTGLSVFLLVISARAQDVNVYNDDEGSKSFIAAGGGLSIPAGLYGSSGTGSDGFALPGVGVFAEGAKFSRFFGFGIRAGYNRHFMNISDFQEYSFGGIPEDATFSADVSGNYTIITAMAGIYTTMSLFPWLQINGKALYGPHFISIPEFSFSYYNEYEFQGQTLIDDWKEEHYAANDWQFGYMIGLGARIKPSSDWSLNIGWDYSESNQSVAYTSNESGILHDKIGNPQVGLGEQQHFFNMKFRYMVVSAGISIFL